MNRFLNRCIFSGLCLVSFSPVFAETTPSVVVSSPSLGSLPVDTPVSTTTAPSNPASSSDISKAAKILRIRIVGNQNVRERVVLSQIKAKKNDPYDDDILRKDVQSIFAMGNFEDVTVDVSEEKGGMVVTFHVVEKPMVKRITFKGNKKLSSGKLRDTLALKEGEPFDKVKLNLDVDKLMTLYKDEGFATAKVEPFTTTEDGNKVSLTFYVTEGSQVLIEKVILEGVTAFKEKKVRKGVKTKRKKVLKQDQLDKDIESIQAYYKNRGYLNVKIGEPKQTFNADNTRLTLTIPIEEGTMVYFGSSTFTGQAIFTSDQLRKNIVYKAGDVYNQQKMDATVARLRDAYGELGYIRVDVKPNFVQDSSSNTVATEFQISEGDVVYVDRISVEGNTHTKDYVIRREVQLKEGEPFSSVKARKSVERLYNLGFLDNVDVDVQQPISPSKADIIFNVTEGKPGILSAGAGFSSVDKLIGTLQVQHVNFLGRGQRLNLMWEFGSRRNSFDIGWTEPWFMGKPVSFGTNLFAVTRLTRLATTDGVIDEAFRTRDLGGNITVGPRFSDIYTVNFTYGLTKRRRYDLASNLTAQQRSDILASTDTTKGEFNALFSNITVQGIRDTRDNYFDPTRGNRLSLAVTHGGLFPGNAVKYTKPILDYSIHFPTFWKFVLSLHAQGGVVKPFGKSTRSDILDELFQLGGPDTVRGYNIGRVGVADRGGEIATFYNVEYKFPIAPDEFGKTLLQGVFFYDVGGSWNRFNDIVYETRSNQTGLKQGVGFGIRFKTPVFPLRLDWGFPLNRGKNDDASRFEFTIGTLF